MDWKKNWTLIVGVAAMALLVWGTFAEGGSLTQKVLFVIGAPVLGVTAFFNKQKMFTVLQLVASVGAVLGFFTETPSLVRYSIMLGVAVISFGYLLKAKYYSTDKWGIIGTIGLICFACAFATDAAAEALIFNSLMITGGVLVAFYSSTSFFIQKVRIAAIWVILNLLLIINPLVFILS